MEDREHCVYQRNDGLQEQVSLVMRLVLFGFLCWPFALCAQSSICASCHAAIARSYRQTGMARSFYRPRAENIVEDYRSKNVFYHAASDLSFAMSERGGHFFQSQYQNGPDGKKINLTEREIDYVLGSGEHARTYLHRTDAGTLVQLPLAWYAESGWAMAPGYDRPDHQDARRPVTYDCMFCHNAYPQIPVANAAPRSAPVFASVPEGIDCQRCHGNGERHVQFARAGGSVEAIRASIVNPSRLEADRRMEVCMQCHLETTSSPLPASIVRYERGPFSYRPSEALGDFIFHFDHARGAGHDDKFEITGSVYRLRQSRCFLESKGALTCTSCHDPHKQLRGEEASQHYAGVCRGCHAGDFDRLVSAGRHSSSQDCVGCHMPKRRTDDVVHAVMTDHWIQRRKPARDLLADKTELKQTEANAYRGKAELYYPAALPRPEDELYLAIAQVSQSSNLKEGIARLTAALEKYRPERSEYYLQLGDALANVGRFGEALPVYEEAVRREPESVAALERMGICLAALRQYPRAEAIFDHALKLRPASGEIWLQLGLARAGAGRIGDAIAAFQKASDIDPDLVEAYNSEGAMEFESGDAIQGEAALRKAIGAQPNYAPAHNNLGNLLAETGRFAEAEYQFQAALRYQENYVGARYNYALALNRIHRVEDARAQVEAILAINPRSAEGHEFLGNILVEQGEMKRAIEEYREAIRIVPGFSQALLGLGAALVQSGDPASALPSLRAASQSEDQATRDQALQILRKLGKVQ